MTTDTIISKFCTTLPVVGCVRVTETDVVGGARNIGVEAGDTRRKPFFCQKCLVSTDSLLIHGFSRPAGLLPFLEKVQLTSVGVFLSHNQRGEIQ